MRRLVFIIAYILYAIICFGQNDQTKFYFPEIGMTIYVPRDFKLQEAKPVPEYLGKGQKPITDSAAIKQITEDDPKILLAIESLDRENIMEIRLIPITKTLIQVMGDSAQYIQTCKEMTIAAARQASEKFDTLFTKFKIGNVMFEKMFTSLIIRGHKYFDGGYVAKIGNYYLSTHMFFKEGKKGKELMGIIEKAEFSFATDSPSK